MYTAHIEFFPIFTDFYRKKESRGEEYCGAHTDRAGIFINGAKIYAPLYIVVMRYKITSLSCTLHSDAFPFHFLKFFSFVQSPSMVRSFISIGTFHAVVAANATTVDKNSSDTYTLELALIVHVCAQVRSSPTIQIKECHSRQKSLYIY